MALLSLEWVVDKVIKRVGSPGVIVGVILLAGALCVRATPNTPDDYDLVADFSAVVAPGPSAYGTNVWWTDEDAIVWTERCDELGVTLVRVPVPHTLVEPVNDNEDPGLVNPSGFLLDTPFGLPSVMTRTITYRSWFEALRDRPGVEAMISFTYLAPWLTDNTSHSNLAFPAAPYPPNDLAEYREYVEVLLRYLVDDLDFPPERLLVEATNEPDLHCGQDSAVPCFWQNWTMQDVADVVQVTYQAIQTVDPRIRLMGLAECCGTTVVRALLEDYPEEGAYLEGLSYHYYSPSGYNLNAALNRAAELAPYDLPIYVDEYGSFQYLSDGVHGGLWHSWALPVMGEAGLIPVQFPISEIPFCPDPYNSMGLFYDWNGDWERKPAYWTYANYFRLMGGGEIISHTAPASVDVLVTRRVVTDRVQAAFWVVNRGYTALVDQSFALYNFPQSEATLHTYDNLVSSAPTLTATVSGSPLVFTTSLPARSSHTFVLSAEQLGNELDHVLLAPDLATCTAGQAISYTLTAYDVSGNDWDVTAGGTYTVARDAGGSWVDHIYTSEIAGTWMVTGTYDGEVDTATLMVNHALLDYVNLMPDAAMCMVGQSVPYALTAYDAHGNSWDVTVSADYSIEPGAGGRWIDNVYTAEVTGTWAVTGTWVETGTAILYHRSDTSSLVVWGHAIRVYLPLIIREYVLH
jgi:hypothetical protein